MGLDFFSIERADAACKCEKEHEIYVRKNIRNLFLKTALEGKERYQKWAFCLFRRRMS